MLPEIGGTSQIQSAGQPPRERYSLCMYFMKDSAAEWWSMMVTFCFWMRRRQRGGIEERDEGITSVVSRLWGSQDGLWKGQVIGKMGQPLPVATSLQLKINTQVEDTFGALRTPRNHHSHGGPTGHVVAPHLGPLEAISRSQATPTTPNKWLPLDADKSNHGGFLPLVSREF